MNQIIWITSKNSINKNNNSDNNYKAKKRYFSVFSLFILLFCFCFVIFVYSHFSKDDSSSDKLLNNYNISQLYSNVSPTLINSNTSFSVLGMIEIPKLNIIYPILSVCNDNNLKISPCKISGPNLNEVGNFAIGGHNYNNSLFFSKIGSLKPNDKIIIYDIDGNDFPYVVTSVFEVDSSDLSVLDSRGNVTELTLVTCTNINSNRIIVKAILEF